MNRMHLVLSLLGAGLLSACGGSSTPTVLTGQVIDGYIEGAKVCLDLNDNGLCDSTDPNTTSGSNGAYSLDAQGNSTAGKHIIAEIPATAKDSDDSGLTLAQAGKQAYTMATPATLPVTITPFTTMVVAKLKSGDAVDADTAKTKVIAALGLAAATDLQKDHTKDSALSLKARQIAYRLQVATGTDTFSKIKSVGDQLSTVTTQALAGDVSTSSVSMSSSVQNQFGTTLPILANASMLAYKMPSAKDGKLVDATAMLFTPKTAAPSTGWPLMVLAVGTTGVASKCAPSLGNFYYADIVSALVNQKVAVVVPDYEGRGALSTGTGDAHPYLNLMSAGRSMALAALASKTKLTGQLSGAWGVVGHSQGGHAALAAAEFSKMAAGMSYKGAVAVAPASGFQMTLTGALSNAASATTPSDISAAYTTLGNINGYAAYMVMGTTFTSTPMDSKVVFGSRMQAVYPSAKTQCLDDFSKTVEADIYAFAGTGGLPKDYQGASLSGIQTPAVASVLNANEPATVPLSGKTLLIQGLSDTTVSPAVTNALASKMETLKSTVTYKTYSGEGHTSVLANTTAQTDIFSFIAGLFASN